MKKVVEDYTFSAASRTLTFGRPAFGNNIDLARLLLIADVTRGEILYQADGGEPRGGPTTVSGNVLTFGSLPAGVSSSDGLQILYDFPQPAGSFLGLPDTNVLSDDLFDNGACGWEELNVPMPTTWALSHMPLTLGTDGHFGTYTLRLTTANVSNANGAGAAAAMKRMTHQAQPGVANKGIIRAEYWFTFGSDGSTAVNPVAVSGATYAQVSGVYYVTLTVASLEYLAAGTWITVTSLGGLTNCGGNAVITSVNTGASTITYPISATPSGTYTSGGTASTYHDISSPRTIQFHVDTQANTDSITGEPRTAGARAQFQATWLQAGQTGSGQPWYSGQWLLGCGSGVPYGASGYFVPNTTPFSTGYYTDFCPNQNKRNLMYVALVVDSLNGVWLGLQANDQYFDLTSIPGNGNAPLASVLAPGDPNYNLADFIGGLNQYVQINNQNSAGVGATYGTASWLELHRTRMSYL